MSVVRAVVLDYDGGQDVVRCVDALAATETAHDLRVVVVDNGSTDGSPEAVLAAHPEVEVRRTVVNRGFGANNDALVDLDGIDVVALVNDDAFVDPGWLDPLVADLDADPGLGAVQAKMVLAPRFVELAVETPASRRRGDRRRLGVAVSGLRVDHEDRWPDVHLDHGGYGREPAPPGVGGQDGAGRRDESIESIEWSGPRARLRVPVSPGVTEGPERVALRLSATEAKPVRLTGANGDVVVQVDREPRWFEVPLGGIPADVINSVGIELLADGTAADRGALALDRGQFDEPAEVEAWTGGAVALRPAYLADVGLFDERFFLYYEDADLSARGRARGWRYRYEPASAVRHRRAASSGVASRLLRWHVERNRLLYLTKHAPAPVVARAVVRHPLSTLSYARRDVLSPMRAGRPVDTSTVRLRLSAYLGYLRLAPAMLSDRRRRHR